MTKLNRLASGLFVYRGRYAFKNIPDIWLLIKRLFYVVRHGYYPQANWDTYAYFTDMMREILSRLSAKRCSHPMSFIDEQGDAYCETDDDKAESKWSAELTHAINLLDQMDENSYQYDGIDSLLTAHESAAKAKDEFMRWFSYRFFDLWD